MDFGVAIHIPKALLLDENLTPTERLLYCVLSTKADVKGSCVATDEELARSLRFKSDGTTKQISKEAVSRMLAHLVELGYVSTKQGAIQLPFLKTSTEVRKEVYADTAKKVLTYLSECSMIRGYRKVEYKASKTNIEPITARLKEGHTYEECVSVINIKFEDDFFKENLKYLTPQTLFRASNFERYVTEAGSVKNIENKVVTKYGLANVTQAKTESDVDGEVF